MLTPKQSSKNPASNPYQTFKFHDHIKIWDMHNCGTSEILDRPFRELCLGKPSRIEGKG